MPGIANRISAALKLLYHICTPTPSYLIFFVTSRCNARCKMCFNWRALNNAENAPELSLEEISAVAKALPNLFEIILSGGEPFLRNDLPELVSLLVKQTKAVVLAIPTNAYSPERIQGMVRTICTNHPNLLVRINVSIDGIGEQHDRIRGVKGIYGKAKKTIAGLKELKKDFPYLAVNVGTVLTSDNIDNIADVFDTVEKDISPDLHSIGFPRGSLRDSKSGEFSVEQYKKAISYTRKKGLCKVKNRKYPFAHFAPAMLDLIVQSVTSALEGKKWPMRCVAAEKIIVISEDGEVSPCEMLGYLKKQEGTLANKELKHCSYGNLGDVGLDIGALLNSDRAKDIKRFIRDQKCQCTFECAIFASLLFQFSSYPMILKQVFRSWKDQCS